MDPDWCFILYGMIVHVDICIIHEDSLMFRPFSLQTNAALVEIAHVLSRFGSELCGGVCGAVHHIIFMFHLCCFLQVRRLFLLMFPRFSCK